MKSMTGYGNAVAQADGREISVELKSVNHRFLDLNIRAPRALLFLEDELRKRIASHVGRGHVEVSVQYRNTRKDGHRVVADEALALQYREAFSVLEELGFENDVRISDLLRVPEMLTVLPGEEDQEALRTLLLEATDKACEALNETRQREGERIGADLLAKLDGIGVLAAEIEEKSNGNREEYAGRLLKRLQDILGENLPDPQRVAQEVAIYADKIAIDEELVRLKTHIENMRAYMCAQESMGKKLDFFIQELNREVNTIGSKSVNADIAALVVTAKGEVEKLREQIQNIE